MTQVALFHSVLEYDVDASELLWSRVLDFCARLEHPNQDSSADEPERGI